MLAATVPNNIGGNICSCVSFLIVSLITFIMNSDSSTYLAVFIKSSISSFEFINVGILDQWIFFWLAASAADITAYNPNGNKTFSTRSVSTLFINGKPADINVLI